MSMLGVTIAFTMRGCLSIAMTQMVVPIKETKIAHEGVCQLPATAAAVDNETASVEDYGGRFDWDQETQGMVLSAFYYGYIVTHIPGGALAQRFGGKFTVAYALMSTGTLTLFTPTVARMGSKHLMVLRFVEGFGEVRSRQRCVRLQSLRTRSARWRTPPMAANHLTTGVTLEFFFGGGDGQTVKRVCCLIPKKIIFLLEII